jgi:Mg-chelatase subunit ChlD
VAACGVDQPTGAELLPPLDAGGTPTIDSGSAPSPDGGGTTGGGMPPAGGTSGGGTLGAGGSPGAGGTLAGGGDGCEAHVAESRSATPDMLVVLDRSGSMNPARNREGTDRWGGSRAAVIEVTAAFDDRVRFGLMTFPSARGVGDEDDLACAPGMLDVALGLDTGDVIATTLQGLNANGGTPTAPSLEEALRVIGSAKSTNPDEVIPPKYVLLVTDGDPNCSGQSRGDEVDELARTQTLAAIQALTDAGVKTYVVGYQTAGSVFAAQLDRMAAAGGTGATAHRSVQNNADLTATMTEIAGGVVSCSFRLDAPVRDPGRVLVTVGGRQRNFNQASDGWILEADNQTVTLTGAACTDVRAGKIFEVQVTCFVVPPA